MQRSKIFAFVFSVLLAIGFISCGVGSARANASKQQYTTKLVTLVASSNGQTLGHVTPATAVTVVETHGNEAKVTLTGWAPKGYTSVVFSAPGKHIIDARLQKNAQMKVLGSKKDAYGDIWHHVSVSGSMSKDALTQDLGSVWHKASKVYANQCSGCHSLKKPSGYSINQWPAILKTMGKKTSLTKAQHALVVKYLQTHAKNANSTD